MNKLTSEQIENALAFLKTKGIINATLYTNKDTYYLVDLAELLGEYANNRTALESVGVEECQHDWDEGHQNVHKCKKCNKYNC